MELQGFAARGSHPQSLFLAWAFSSTLRFLLPIIKGNREGAGYGSHHPVSGPFASWYHSAMHCLRGRSKIWRINTSIVEAKRVLVRPSDNVSQIARDLLGNAGSCAGSGSGGWCTCKGTAPILGCE